MRQTTGSVVSRLTFSTLLFLGLGTRLATLPFLGMIAVIQTFVYPNAWIEHLVWPSILLFLLTRGGGWVSLDQDRTPRAVVFKWP